MIEVAHVFRRFARTTSRLAAPPSHRGAIDDTLECRTAALGGQVWRCDACGTEVFSFHSCGNRSCPKCHTPTARARCAWARMGLARNVSGRRETSRLREPDAGSSK